MGSLKDTLVLISSPCSVEMNRFDDFAVAVESVKVG